MTYESVKNGTKDFILRWAKQLLIVPPILLAIGVLIFVTKNRPPLEERTDSEVSRALRTIVAPQLEVRPSVVGYGTAEYAKKWRAVTQVAGRLKSIHPELRPGAIISEDEVLLIIDDADYRSAVEELTASIEQKEAEILQLEQTKVNYDKTLTLEREVLAVLDGELGRAKSLEAQRAGSQSSIDTKRRAVISQQQVIQGIENNKSLIEPQIQSLQAGIRQSTAQREQAQRDIERAELKAPFTMRIGDVDLEVGQYVAANENLFEGYSFSEMEIEVQVSMADIERLLTTPLTNLPVPGELTMENMRSVFKVTATVEISGAASDARYEGRFLRVREVVDAQTRQVGIVIGVSNGREPESGRPKPPVLEGAFCKVTLVGEPLGERVIVPRSAVHGTTVYVVDGEGRLAKREIASEFSQKDYTVISSGLSPGERVIVSDPSPAIIGTLIEPVDDSKTMGELQDAVTQQGARR